jgi:hypothetical protein
LTILFLAKIPSTDRVSSPEHEQSGAPNPASLVDRTKERAGCNPGGRRPGANPGLHPIRDRNRSYVAALADKIGYDPVFLSPLYVFSAQRSQLRPA